jgi:hypothetical protein
MTATLDNIRFDALQYLFCVAQSFSALESKKPAQASASWVGASLAGVGAQEPRPSRKRRGLSDASRFSKLAAFVPPSEVPTLLCKNMMLLCGKSL